MSYVRGSIIVRRRELNSDVKLFVVLYVIVSGMNDYYGLCMYVYVCKFDA